MTRPGISTPIYKLDCDSVRDVLGSDVTVSQMPALVVDAYNRSKGGEVFARDDGSVVDGCAVEVYRNVQTTATRSPWVKFYEPAGLMIPDVRSQMQHLAGFICVGEDLFVHTAGQSVAMFERFIDVSFPIEVARRIARPEVKGARSSQITGRTLASIVQFRDARRLTRAESLENVWTALSGQVRETALTDPIFVDIFGVRKKMRLDVTGAIKIGPRIETAEKLLLFLRWLLTQSEADLPADDAWSVLDSVKVLNPRKRKDLIARLHRELANLISQHDYADLAIMHADSALYDNATSYVAQQGAKIIYEDGTPPGLEDVAGAADVNPEDPVRILNTISIQSSSDDHGAGFGTHGSLLAHLNGEVRFEDKTYFLLGGKWYEVDAVFIDAITEDFLEIMRESHIEASQIGMRPWLADELEDEYNDSSVTAPIFINGDKVLTDNVELFDGLVSRDGITYVIHVKRGFDVKVRDVRSQIVNSANMIENDIRTGHYARLQEARMEAVSLNSQFRQVSSSDLHAKLCMTWIEVVS